MDTTAPKLLAVASGKGGVGKTLLAACLATIMNEQENYKGRTLLVDMDFGVKGLTFLAGNATYWEDHTGCMVDVLEGKDSEAVLTNAARIGDLRVIPSDIYFHRQIKWDEYFKRYSTLESTLRKFVLNASQKGIGFVVFDTGAGIDSALLALAGLVEKVVVVVEPDEISHTAALDLYGELENVAKDVNFIVNKIPRLGESEGHAISEVNYLPPLPFDHKMQVKFVRDARSIMNSGFRKMRYRRYVQRAARALYHIESGGPTWWDHVSERTATKVIMRLFGYGMAFIVLVTLLLMIIGQVLF